MTAEKVYENRVRRAARRQGLVLRRSRRRDPRAIDYRRYWVVNENGAPVVGGELGLTLNEAEHYLLHESPGALRAAGRKEG